MPTDPDTDKGFDSMTGLRFSTAFLTHPWKERTVDGRPGTSILSAHKRTKGSHYVKHLVTMKDFGGGFLISKRHVL